MQDPSKTAYRLSIVAGLVLWVLTAVIGGRAEPWGYAAVLALAKLASAISLRRTAAERVDV